MTDRPGLLREDSEGSEALQYLVQASAELVQAAVAAHGNAKRGTPEEASSSAAEFMRKVDQLLAVAEVARDVLHGGPPSDN